MLSLSCALWVAAAPAVDLMVPEDFSSHVAEKIRAVTPGAKVEVESQLQLRIDHPKSGRSTVRLDEAYQAYLQSPDKVDEIVERFTSGAVEAVPMSGIDSKRIVPIIKPRGWLAEIGFSGDDKDTAPVVYDSLNAELIIVYAENTPNSLSYFSPAELAEAKIERRRLRGLAADNLVRILPKIERRTEEGVFRVVADGEFETSLLAVGSGWRRENFDVKGDFVFAAPARGSLYITGSDDKAGIEKLRGYARTEYRDSPQKISPKLFVQRGSKLDVLPE